MQNSIAIIGGGPAGATLAGLLAKQGKKVGLFQIPKRPALIVGESMLPAIVPFLQELGIEQKVKSFSTYKPGATICLSNEEILGFGFNLAKTNLDYAYNVPRDEFDKALIEAAKTHGASIFHKRASIEVKNGKPCLSQDTLAAADGFFDGENPFIVDASGRSRLLATALDLPTHSGDRKDLAIFAHYTGVEIQDEGNIHVDRLEKGWAWRIPLPGRVSVGIVINPEHLNGLGKTKEEQYENFIRQDAFLSQFMKKATRTTPVVVYNNYQKQTQKLVGEGWALAGDGAGFLDPVFSTGVYLAMRSATRLSKALLSRSPNAALRRYEKVHLREISVWEKIVNYWYDGSLFTLYRVGQHHVRTPFGKIMEPHMTKHITKIFTGESGKGTYSSRLLAFMTKYGIYGHSTDPLKIY